MKQHGGSSLAASFETSFSTCVCHFEALFGVDSKGKITERQHGIALRRTHFASCVFFADRKKEPRGSQELLTKHVIPRAPALNKLNKRRRRALRGAKHRLLFSAPPVVEAPGSNSSFWCGESNELLATGGFWLREPKPRSQTQADDVESRGFVLGDVGKAS